MKSPLPWSQTTCYGHLIVVSIPYFTPVRIFLLPKPQTPSSPWGKGTKIVIHYVPTNVTPVPRSQTSCPTTSRWRRDPWSHSSVNEIITETTDTTFINVVPKSRSQILHPWIRSYYPSPRARFSETSTVSTGSVYTSVSSSSSLSLISYPLVSHWY